MNNLNFSPNLALQANSTPKTQDRQPSTYTLLNHNRSILKDIYRQLDTLRAEQEDLGVNYTDLIARIEMKRKQVSEEIDRLLDTCLANAKQHNQEVRAIINETLYQQQTTAQQEETIEPVNAIRCFAGRTLREKFWNNTKFMLFVGHRLEIEEILRQVCNEQFFMKRNGENPDQAKLFVPRNLFHLLKGATTVKFTSLAA